jgi:hypothetical protein
MWWNLVGLLLTGLVTLSLVQRDESTWAGIVVHGLGNALWLTLLGVVVSFVSECRSARCQSTRLRCPE